MSAGDVQLSVLHQHQSCDRGKAAMFAMLAMRTAAPQPTEATDLNVWRDATAEPLARSKVRSSGGLVDWWSRIENGDAWILEMGPA